MSLVRFIMVSSIAVACCSGRAETASALAQQPTNAQQSSASTPELLEADKASLEVVKLYREGKFEDAIPLAKQVLKLREKSLGATHPRVADAAGNLAVLYVAANKPDDAEPFFKRALAIYEKNPNQDLLVAKMLENIAFLRSGKREYSKAEELYLRAISIKEKVLRVNHAETLASLSALAALYATQKLYSKEEVILRKVVAGKETQAGQSQELGGLLERLACSMYRNNEKTDSEKTEERANHLLYGEATKKPEPILLPQEIFLCKVLSFQQPVFPDSAKGGRFTGTTKIVIAVEVDEAGNVTSANMVGGNPLFKKTSEQAALTAKLRPTIVDGRPVKVRGVLTHEFSVETRRILVPGSVIGRP